MEKIPSVAEYSSDKNYGITTQQVPGFGIRVDLMDRIVYFDPEKTDLTTDWHPASDIAEWIEEISPNKVKKVAKSLGIERDENCNYPPLTYELVEQEIQWEQLFKGLPKHITVNLIHNELGWGKSTIIRHASNLGYVPNKKGRYPKQLISDLRMENMSVPYDEGWLTKMALQKELKAWSVCGEWVDNRLNNCPYDHEKRRTSNDHSVREHYSPEVLSYLLRMAANIPLAGADWFTEGYICGEIGCSFNWIHKRISQFKDTAEFRLDDVNIPRLHYPNEVMDAMKFEYQKIAPSEENVGWVSIEWIAEKFEISENAAVRALLKIGITRKRIKTDNIRPQYFYNGDEVMNIVWDIAEADHNMITLGGLATELGFCTKVVSEHLTALGIKPSFFEHIGGNRIFYDKKVIELVKKAMKAKHRGRPRKS